MASAEATATAADDAGRAVRGLGARSVDQVTRTPNSPTTPPRAASARRALDYDLLAPPNYGNIVGGAPPSPIASLLLLVGAIVIVVAAAVGAFGMDTTQWWEAGGVLALVGLFLAAFVTRR